MSLQIIGVAGLGLLGRGIVTSLLASGFRVVAPSRVKASAPTRAEYIAIGISELVRAAECRKRC